MSKPFLQKLGGPAINNLPLFNDAVLSIESRGFIVGSSLSTAEKIRFVPIRKGGKLPGKVIGVDYTLDCDSFVTVTLGCTDETACNYGEECDCTYAEEGYDCDGNLYINITYENIANRIRRNRQHNRQRNRRRENCCERFCAEHYDFSISMTFQELF